MDTLPGSASVLGLMNDADNRVQLVIDTPVTQSDTFGCHPCKNTSSLKLRTGDLLEKIPARHPPHPHLRDTLNSTEGRDTCFWCPGP